MLGMETSAKNPRSFRKGSSQVELVIMCQSACQESKQLCRIFTLGPRVTQGFSVHVRPGLGAWLGLWMTPSGFREHYGPGIWLLAMTP